MAKQKPGKDWVKFENFLLDIQCEKSAPNFKFPDLWCNNDRLQKEIPLTVGENKEKVHVYYRKKGKRFTTSKTPLPTVQLFEEGRNRLRTEYESLANAFLKPRNPYDFLGRLFQYDYKEATSRVFVNVLLKTVAIETDVWLKPGNKAGKTDEEKRKFPDDTIYQYDVPLGVIEVKRGKALIRESIIQCMQQLDALQRTNKEKGQHIPLFGIVTDALHYIFLKLQPDGQHAFEQKQQRSYLKVHRANTWHDLYEIAATIKGLCQLRKRYCMNCIF